MGVSVFVDFQPIPRGEQVKGGEGEGQPGHKGAPDPMSYFLSCIRITPYEP